MSYEQKAARVDQQKALAPASEQFFGLWCLTLFVNVVNSRCEIFFKERKDGEEESLNPVSCESIS